MKKKKNLFYRLISFRLRLDFLFDPLTGEELENEKNITFALIFVIIAKSKFC